MERKANKSGDVVWAKTFWEIRLNSGREQPYTVWWGNETFKFCRTIEEARRWVDGRVMPTPKF